MTSPQSYPPPRFADGIVPPNSKPGTLLKRKRSEQPSHKPPPRDARRVARGEFKEKTTGEQIFEQIQEEKRKLRRLQPRERNRRDKTHERGKQGEKDDKDQDKNELPEKEKDNKDNKENENGGKKDDDRQKEGEDKIIDLRDWLAKQKGKNADDVMGGLFDKLFGMGYDDPKSLKATMDRAGSEAIKDALEIVTGIPITFTHDLKSLSEAIKQGDGASAVAAGMDVAFDFAFSALHTAMVVAGADAMLAALPFALLGVGLAAAGPWLREAMPSVFAMFDSAYENLGDPDNWENIAEQLGEGIATFASFAWKGLKKYANPINWF